MKRIFSACLAFLALVAFSVGLPPAEAAYKGPFIVPGTALNATPKPGWLEFDSNKLYFTGLATRGRLIPAFEGSATWDVASLVDAAGATSSAITVTGAALGDYVVPSMGVDTQGITFTAWVESANTVKVRAQNETSGTIDLASTTVRVLVFDLTP